LALALLMVPLELVIEKGRKIAVFDLELNLELDWTTR
jgi:hypothetical protein